jgi:beta-glucanase (GH16 family)
VNTGPWTLAAALLTLAAAPGCSEEAEPMQPYGLIWQDEFDGPAGQLPDPARWRFDLGNLAITARNEPYEEQAYTSARIKTMGLFEQTRGRFEARIKLPIGQGIWPAFWLLGNDIDQVGWPQCGEIDVMEYRGQEPRVLVGSIHGPGYSGNGAITQTHTLAQGGFHLGFHEFAIE